MAKQILFFLCGFLAVINAKVFAPRDLTDEVLEQLSELGSTVEGVILAAHSNLGNLLSDFATSAFTVTETGIVNIQQEQETINAEVTAIKDLANAANVDHYTCTNVREQVLDRMPNTFIEELNTCINQIDAEASRITSDARYLVDVVINKVRQLENQVRRCNGQFECVSQLVPEIELDKIRLPQNILTEVQAAQSFLEILRLSVQACSDDSVSEYVIQASSIVLDIEACVNRLLGG